MRRTITMAAVLVAATAGSAGAATYRHCSVYVNFAHVTAVRGISCATGGLIAEAYANLVLAGGRPYPKRLARYICAARDPHPNSPYDHIAVTCSLGTKAVRFSVGP